MMQTKLRIGMTTAAIAGLLALAPAAFAATSTNSGQSPGVTSGPATNTATLPNSAVTAGNGAAGQAAKGGTEAGTTTGKMQAARTDANGQSTNATGSQR